MNSLPPKCEDPAFTPGLRDNFIVSTIIAW